MFKSITAFKIGDRATKLALLNPDLADLLEEHGAPPPSSTQWCCYGFSKPSCFGSSFAFDGAMGARVLCVRRSERILPGTVIKQELAAKVKRIEEKEGRRCHRKEIASLKDDVIAALLPKAFIKNTDYKVLIAGDYVMFDCTSVKMVDEMVATLMYVIVGNGLVDTLRLQLVQGRDVAKWLKSIALDDQEDLDGNIVSNFQHLDSAVLKGDGVVRLKDLEFDTDVGAAALASSMHFQELAVGWGAEPGEVDLHCCINDNLLVKRLKFSDVLLKQAKEDSDEDEVSYFDATVAIAAGLLVKMFDNILEAVGVEDEDDEETGWEGLDVLGAAIKARTEALKDVTVTITGNDVPEGDGSERDGFYPQAKQHVIETQTASISALQRKLRIGYNRAAALIETLEWNGVVSEPDASGVRTVLEEDEL